MRLQETIPIEFNYRKFNYLPFLFYFYPRIDIIIDSSVFIDIIIYTTYNYNW